MSRSRITFASNLVSCTLPSTNAAESGMRAAKPVEVVNDHHVAAAGEQLDGNMRPDVVSAAGKQPT